MRESEKSRIEDYIESLLPEESAEKQLSRKAAADWGLARISVAPHEARLIQILVSLSGARRFVEIGTLAGLSAQYIWEALPEDGELWTLEKSPEHAAAAREIFAQLNAKNQSAKKLHLLEGDAREVLPQLAAQGPFDGVFIDGNKAAYGDYLQWAEQHIVLGGLILADNVFLSGAVWGASTTQKFSPKQIQVLRDFNQRLSNTKLFQGVIVPTQEGLFVARKLF